MAWPDNRVANTARYLLEYLGFGSRVAPFPVRRLAGPWTLADVSPRDDGFEVKAPDFVGVGTQKSGTSWWAALIEEHPGVSLNRFGRKEMHYFTHFLEQPLTDEAIHTYVAAFARSPGQLCGEWTPNYMASPYTIGLIKQAVPDAKILVMVRDPIARYESGYNHEFKRRYGGIIGPRIRMSVVKQYALRKESIWNGMYGAQLEVVLDHFPREQVLVLQYERCRDEPETEIARTYRFLGLDDSYQPNGLTRSVNLQRRVVERLSDESREKLATLYRPDVERLANLVPDSIDLERWPAFASAATPVGSG